MVKIGLYAKNNYLFLRWQNKPGPNDLQLDLICTFTVAKKNSTGWQGIGDPIQVVQKYTTSHQRVTGPVKPINKQFAFQ